jgi:hypothetical protein
MNRTKISNINITDLEESMKSKEELHFLWFLEELLQKNFIKSYSYEPTPIIINKPCYYKTLNNKNKVVTRKLIPEKTYTYDFLIIWSNLANGVFFFDIAAEEVLIHKYLIPAQLSKENELYNFMSRIEVKGEYDMNNMTRLARSNIAYVWDKYKLYIHIVKPYDIFKNLFYPKRFAVTDNNMTRERVRKGLLIKDLMTFDDYIKMINTNEIKQ